MQETQPRARVRAKVESIKGLDRAAAFDKLPAALGYYEPNAGMTSRANSSTERKASPSVISPKASQGVQ
jgi:hypothetical protein